MELPKTTVEGLLAGNYYHDDDSWNVKPVKNLGMLNEFVVVKYFVKIEYFRYILHIYVSMLCLKRSYSYNSSTRFEFVDVGSHHHLEYYLVVFRELEEYHVFMP